MSLFGDDSNQPSQSKSSLFDEGGATSKSGSGLFADDTATGSPWDFPSPKKAARGNLVKTLLPATDVPESYIDAYDALLETDRVGSGVGFSGAKRLLQGSGIGVEDQQKIENLVLPSANGSTEIGRGEFNVLLALIGLGQEDEEISLDGVDERRKSMS
jgi:sorting nexin-8